MAHKITVRMGSGLSKKEEIGALKDLAAAVEGEDCYLADLLSPAFVGWVETVILSDIGPDMAERFAGALEEADRMRVEIMRKNEEIKIRTETEAKLVAEIGRLQGLVLERDRRIKDAKAVLIG